MRFEDMDNKIREAAEQHHPPYDEKAWRKMEKLLNQHLPLEKADRRRILFFLLLLLLIGGGGYLMISQPWNKSGGAASSLVQNTKNADASNKELTNATESERNETNQKTNRELNDQNIASTKLTKERTTTLNPGEQKQSNKDQKNKILNRSSVQTDRAVKQNAIPSKNQSPVAEGNKNSAVAAQDNANLQRQETTPITKSNEESVNKSEDVKKQVTEKSTQEVVTTDTKPSPKKIATVQNKNGFSFSVSAGPDVSKAGSSKTGKTTMVYGAGVGYTLNRFTLRTGLFVAKKIYWANAADYKLNYAPPPTVKFVGANANCDVFEIPVKLSYNFGMSSNSNWFAGAGLSSYLMKKETYLYQYKTSTGSSSYKYQTKNENKHYFSVLDLSAGYARQLNKTLSITAEPYVEIPLTGIGTGKVHLQSGGMLFTLGVRHFKK